MTAKKLKEVLTQEWDMEINSELKKIANKNSIAKKGIIEYNFIGNEKELKEAGHSDYTIIVLIKDDKVISCMSDEATAENEFLKEYLDI